MLLSASLNLRLARRFSKPNSSLLIKNRSIQHLPRERPGRPILAIECSCDDTAAAIVTVDRRVLGETVIKQDEIHLPWRGIVPRLAGEAHALRMDEAIRNVMNQARMPSFDHLDAIAFTRGPGLSACLDVGVKTVKKLSLEHGLPIIGVNHMEGHALAIRFENPHIHFPFLTLLVSGGHSQVVVALGVGQYKLLGETLDIAVGDAFDKVARALSICDLNGGRELEIKAKVGNPLRYPCPIPMTKFKNCDMSFSGIETAINNKIEELGGVDQLDSQQVADLAASFQYAVTKHIIAKVKNGIKWCIDNKIEIGAIVVSGGVACNSHLFENIKMAFGNSLEILRPSSEMCRDNAVMIGWAAQENISLGKSIVEAEGLRYIPRWPLDATGTDYFPNSHRTHTRTEIKTQRNQSLEKYKQDLAEEPKQRLFLKACRVALALESWDDAKEIIQNGLKVFPNDPWLVQMSEKVDKKYELWRNKWA